MSIELKPSRSYPGRTALHHKAYPESNTTTILDLTPEDVHELRKALHTTITTVAELDALAEESVVRSDEGTVWESDSGVWFETASRLLHVASDIALPAIILYEPAP